MLAAWPDAEHARRWSEAVSDDPALRLSALNFWARRLNKLPGPILFTVPKSEHLLGKWQRLMRVSKPYCGCGERRWLFPEHSVPFYPEIPAPITVGPGTKLALGAWGADTQQTQIQVSVQDGVLVTRMLPYSTRSHAELAALGNKVLEDVEVGADESGLRLNLSGTPRGGGPFARDSLKELAEGIAEQQRPINRTIAIQIEGTTEVLLWTMYQITKVDLEAGAMEVVVSAPVQIMDRSRRASPHVCTL